MRLRRLQSGCCCWPLREASAAIGLVHCLLDAVGAIWLCLLVSDRRLVRRLLASEPEISPEGAERTPDLETVTGAVRAAALLLLSLLLLSLPANVALLVGCARRRRRWLLPWLGWQGALLAAQLLLALTTLLGALASLETAAETWGVVTLQLAALAASGYCYAVVASLFVQIRENDKDYATAPIMT